MVGDIRIIARSMHRNRSEVVPLTAMLDAYSIQDVIFVVACVVVWALGFSAGLQMK